MMSIDTNRITKSGFLVVISGLCLLATSCGMLSRPAPEKTFFAIDPGEFPAPTTSRTRESKPPDATPGRGVLKVRRLRVASPYDGQALVYRTKGDQFRSDYYNGFIASPDQLLTGTLVTWLSRIGVFESVVNSASDIPAQYVLEGNFTALYGDYTNKAAPMAVMALTVFLLDDSDAQSRILFQKEYRATSPIESGSADSLVKGWGTAFRQILERVSGDIRGLALVVR